MAICEEMIDDKIDPGTEEQKKFDMLQDKISNILKENLPDANKNEEKYLKN